MSLFKYFDKVPKTNVGVAAVESGLTEREVCRDSMSEFFILKVFLYEKKLKEKLRILLSKAQFTN